MYKRIILLIIFINPNNFIVAQQNPWEIWQKQAYEPAQISFLLYDIQNNKKVLSLNDKKSMIPASTMKLVTTATALEKFGGNHRFETAIYIQGHIDKQSKILYGNLVIKGLGDPTLGSKYFYNYENRFAFIDSITNILVRQNISKISGKIIVDASAFSDEAVAPSSNWEDMANYYACGAYAISVFDNLFTIHFSSPLEPEKPTKIIEIEPYIPNLSTDNRVLSSNRTSDQAYIFGQAFNNNIIIRGTIPKAKADFKIKGAIPNPNLYFAYIVDSLLNIKKITTLNIFESNFEAQSNLKFIGKFSSPTLADIIYFTNKKSINQYADQLIANIAVENKKLGSIRNGTESITNFWKDKNMPNDGLYIADGSGLSRQNSISAEQLVFLLNYMRHSTNYPVFANSLAVNGKNGTMKSFGKRTIPAGAIWAKTGTFRQVRSLSGYLKAKSGKEYAFALLINNYNTSSGQVRKDMEVFLNQIFLNF